MADIDRPQVAGPETCPKRKSAGRFGDEPAQKKPHTVSKIVTPAKYPTTTDYGSPTDTTAASTQASTPLTTHSDSQVWPWKKSKQSRTAARAARHICPFEDCGKVYDRLCNFNDHLRSHRNEKPFQCEYGGCESAFGRREHLQRHVKDIHTNTLETFSCTWPDCTMTFKYRTRLKRHIGVHERRENFRCKAYPPCNQLFDRQTALKNHIDAVHLNKNVFSCDWKIEEGKNCGATYLTNHKLQQHINDVHQCDDTEQHICVLCEVVLQDDGATYEFPTFGTVNALKAHVKEAHKPTCEHCGLLCKSARGLKAHVQQTHSGLSVETVYHDCPYQGCQKTFRLRKTLNAHIQGVHLGHRRFVCGVTDVKGSRHLRDLDGAGIEWDGKGCGLAFKAKIALEEHIRTQHLGLERRGVMSKADQNIGSELLKHLEALRTEEAGQFEKGQSRCEPSAALAAAHMPTELPLIPLDRSRQTDEHDVYDEDDSDDSDDDELPLGYVHDADRFWANGLQETHRNEPYKELESFWATDFVRAEECDVAVSDEEEGGMQSRAKLPDGDAMSWELDPCLAD